MHHANPDSRPFAFRHVTLDRTTSGSSFVGFFAAFWLHIARSLTSPAAKFSRLTIASFSNEVANLVADWRIQSVLLGCRAFESVVRQLALTLETR